VKGNIGIGEDRMEEGEMSTITQLRQIERRGRTQTPACCTIKNSLEIAPICCGNAAPTSKGRHTKAKIQGWIYSRKTRSFWKGHGI